MRMGVDFLWIVVRDIRRGGVQYRVMQGSIQGGDGEKKDQSRGQV